MVGEIARHERAMQSLDGTRQGEVHAQIEGLEHQAKELHAVIGQLIERLACVSNVQPLADRINLQMTTVAEATSAIRAILGRLEI